MGFSKKHQLDGESEAKKWVIAGIAIRAPPLKPISTGKPPKVVVSSIGDDEDDEPCSTTPTAKEARIPEKFSCPPAPRKRRPASKCHGNGVREFFTPPDLESVFIKLERAN